MQFNFAGKIRVGYLSAFILLLISYILTFYTNWQLTRQNERVNHTNKVINNLEVLMSEMKDAETSYRGYVLMKDDKFLDLFYPSHRYVDSVYLLLKDLTSDQTTDGQLQSERLEHLRALIDEKFVLLNNGITGFKQTDFNITDETKARGYYGKKLMDSIRFNIGLMQRRENEVLERRTQRVSASVNAIKVINITSLIIAILVASYSIITFNAENRAKEQAANQARQYQGQLEERVNELKKVNQELVSLRSMEKFATTGRLARTIAHEIRNPLTNITLAADQLKSEIPLNDDSSMLFEMINRNSIRINQLITDLLNSTKFSELKYESISINAVLDEALELANDRIQLNKIKVEKNYSTDICDVSVDKEKLKIALLNIIVNAAEAMPPEKGILQLKTESKNNKCIVTITDNGSGMDDETLSKLFEPYFTGKAKGNGLGLTNTQNIILNHKGSIEVESTLNKGTSFIITLNFPDQIKNTLL
ncbi:MAG: CHASE3 domain-containing protein [Bacteroidetes bacterium]|nr:CHASE3 domain-containing protein [Bacteroidota bacterium]MBS1933199.1 CHASE3 domain-containing protein [Bacteroidota bacterium]